MPAGRPRPPRLARRQPRAVVSSRSTTSPTSHQAARSSTAAATNGWPGYATGWSSSTGGSMTGCGPVCPTRGWPAMRRGTSSPPGSSTRWAGALANRVRRLAGLVGARPDWHELVLAELGVLHLLAEAGQRLGDLPAPLADAVATACGWQVRQSDVLSGVPDTDEWIVAGRSDTREDRIEVRRTWLYGETSRVLGDGPLVRRLSPDARHVVARW